MRWGYVIGILLLLVLGVALVYPLAATAHDDVGFCLNCHLMEAQGASHATSFHKGAATCSDCHTGSLLQKYSDGARHVTANLAGQHPDPITLRESSKQVVAGQCATCHADQSLHARIKRDKGENCLQCHSGHDPRPVILPGVK